VSGQKTSRKNQGLNVTSPRTLRPRGGAACAQPTPVAFTVNQTDRETIAPVSNPPHISLVPDSIEHGPPEQFHSFGLHGALERTSVVFGIDRRFVAFFMFQLPATSNAARFFVAQIQRDPPKPGRELPRCVELLSTGEHAREGLLRQILSAVLVARHAITHPADARLPARHELRKGRVIARQLQPAHELLVAIGAV
jgi:hypothetical protein